MEYIICLILIVLVLLILGFVFGINLKKIKKLSENKNLDEIVERFPENKEICNTILKMLKNESVTVEENTNYNTSLYIAITNKIIISKMKSSFVRIQTIAHECLHSIQSRKILMFNYIFSNIYIIYFILAVILTILNIFKNYQLQIFILTILGFVQYIVRSYLETDAIIKAKYLSKEYIDKTNICTSDEKGKLIAKYTEITNIGVLLVNYNLLLKILIKILIYIIVAFTLQNII